MKCFMFFSVGQNRHVSSTLMSLMLHAAAHSYAVFSLSNLGVNAHFLIFTVVLMATSPAYFRGFTLIALKEGREGTVEDDYAGHFQVSSEDTD